MAIPDKDNEWVSVRKDNYHGDMCINVSASMSNYRLLFQKNL